MSPSLKQFFFKFPLFPVIFFLISTSAIYAQNSGDFIVKLNPKNYSRIPCDFYITAIEDQREQKDYIGFAYKGLLNVKKHAKFKLPLAQTIEPFLSKILPEDEGKRKIKLIVHQLWITEKLTTNYDVGNMTLNVEFIHQTEEGEKSLGVFDKFLEGTGFNVTTSHGRRIEQGFISCIKSLIVRKTKTGDKVVQEKLSFLNGVPTDLKEGFYRNFNDLTYNKNIDLPAKIKVKNYEDGRTRFIIKDKAGNRLTHYAYFTGNQLLFNSNIILGLTGNYYLPTLTTGRFLAILDLYSTGSSGFGLIGLAANTKQRITIIDTKTSAQINFDELVLLVLDTHPEVVKAYNETHQKVFDQITTVQTYNDLLKE